MKTEHKRIEMWSMPKGLMGHISLDTLAVPATVRVNYLGRNIIPSSFNALGHPNFTEEQGMMFSYLSEEYRRKNGKDATLLATVTYEEGIFDEPLETFDTIEGVKDSIGSLADLNTMLKNRTIYRCVYPKRMLHEYMLFGCFKLDSFGQFTSLKRDQVQSVISDKDVEPFSDFCENNPRSMIFTSDGYAIPDDGDVCPCCGKKFTVKDLTRNRCTMHNGKYYHDACWREYRKYEEIADFTSNLMNLIYKESDYTFELLPNGYCREECCSHIPWFLFHTIDGDIAMGWRKRVISIEWRESYRPFEFDELFKNENVTKYQENGVRGIHAWGKEAAFNYLQKVRDAIRPNYSLFT